MTNNSNILLRNGYVDVHQMGQGEPSQEALATVLMNLEYYGFSLSIEAYRAITALPSDVLGVWWTHLETELKAVTGDDRNIGDFVVYKNFPAEVLAKTEAEYWIPQILMYWGLPNELFTEPVQPREGMDPNERKSRTLMLAGSSTLQSILNSLLASKARWNDQEFGDVVELSKTQYVDFSKIVFKENLVKLASYFIQAGAQITVKTATDVLRLAAGLSDGDVSLREKVQFKSFNRKTRRFLMNMLESCGNLVEDVARRTEVWKKFLHNLHPGEFQKSHPRVVKVADDLYNGRLVTFSSQVENLIKAKDANVLELLAQRPGEFMRRLVHVLDVFGDQAADAFIKVIPRLTVHQIVSIRRFLEITHLRTYRVFPPKGNWGKLQLGKPRPVKAWHVDKLSAALGEALAQRVPAVRVLDDNTEQVKLPNGNDEGTYARGTVFKIPEHVKFIRTASYWQQKSPHGYGNIWFDNGWNFFGEDWEVKGACCWTDHRFLDGAVFSGDPTNSKEMQGRAAQLIDLYLDKLEALGVRYAVWNVLCYSGIPFAQATEVFAALQWGTDPQKGKLFEPSRAQLAFPLTGDYKTKYVCLIDLKTREMIYLDANLRGTTQSAARNGKTLSEQMPAFMEYISALPSVHDLFKESVNPSGNAQVLYTSKDVELNEGESCYIFQHEGDQDYEPLDLNKILGG